MNRMPHSICALAIAVCAVPGLLAQDQRGILYGSPAAPAQAERSVALPASAKWVNVKQGETVRFTVGNVEFAWQFTGRSAKPFDLREIAPAGSLASEVTVYVAPPTGHRP